MDQSEHTSPGGIRRSGRCGFLVRFVLTFRTSAQVRQICFTWDTWDEVLFGYEVIEQLPAAQRAH